MVHAKGFNALYKVVLSKRNLTLWTPEVMSKDVLVQDPSNETSP